MIKDGHPLPETGWRERLALNVMPPLQGCVSGELTANSVLPLGLARFKGAVKDVFISVAASGKDDSNTLSVAGEVRINGTTCLSTQPAIAHVSGEASQQKTTGTTGDTGITAAVLDYTNYTFDIGDYFEAEFKLTRTASPTTEIANPCIIVELEPRK
jgi:hypothetical protein